MPAGGAPRLGTTIVRALRLRCAACGRGRVFRLGIRRAETCHACGWRFERGAGHWVGGAETHMFASYGASVLLAMPFLLFARPGPRGMLLLLAGHVALSLLFYRLSRSLFLAIDYYLDPTPPSPGGGRDPEPETEILYPPTPPPRRKSRETVA